MTPRFTSVHDRCAFISLRANFLRVRTDSEKVAICGSGSGSVSSSCCRRGTVDRNPR
jgi:hypothetical protein